MSQAIAAPSNRCAKRFKSQHCSLRSSRSLRLYCACSCISCRWSAQIDVDEFLNGVPEHFKSGWTECKWLDDRIWLDEMARSRGFAARPRRCENQTPSNRWEHGQSGYHERLPEKVIPEKHGSSEEGTRLVTRPWIFR